MLCLCVCVCFSAASFPSSLVSHYEDISLLEEPINLATSASALGAQQSETIVTTAKTNMPMVDKASSEAETESAGIHTLTASPHVFEFGLARVTSQQKSKPTPAQTHCEEVNWLPIKQPMAVSALEPVCAPYKVAGICDC